MLRKIIIPLAMLVLLACSKDENTSSPFPEIETISSTVFSNGGVKLNGEIKNIGDQKILDYGFELFANGGNVYYNVNHQSNQPAKKGTFSVEIKYNLYPDLEYAYTAYIRTLEDIYKGERLTFVSNGSATPILEKCTPSLSHVGDTISLTGSNFPLYKNDIGLKFGESYAQIVSTSDKEIKFIVPNPSSSSRVLEMEAYRNKVSKSGLLNLHKPTISSISPKDVFFGDTLVISGNHFNLKKHFTNVEIGGIRAEMISTSRNKIEVVFPKDVSYNNYGIKLYAQRQYIDYSNFTLQMPKILSVPNAVYFNEYFEIKVDQVHPDRNYFFLGGNELYPEIVDDETIKFYVPNGGVYAQRENHLIWKINDKEIQSEILLKISNPFFKIKEGWFAIEEGYQTFNISNEVIAISIHNDNSDERRYLFTYDEVNNKWVEKAMLNINGTPVALGPSSSGIMFTYSEYDNAIYGLHQSQYTNNFIKVDVNTGNVTYLPINHDSSFYGKGFCHNNNVFFLSAINNKLWGYNIDNQTWTMATNTPFEKGNYRQVFMDAVVIDNNAYFLNGSNGSLYHDFWKLNLSNLSWERLTDNPVANKYSTSFFYKNELYSITGDIWKYNINTNVWQQVEKSGLNSNIGSPINGFMHKNLPYFITHSIFTNVTYLNLFKGDLL